MSIVDDRQLRRSTTQKWGLYTFYSAVVILVLVTLFNCVFSPKIRNPESTQRVIARRLKSLPWMQIGMVSWTIVIIYMSLIQTHGSLIWFAKRTGRLAVALMPAMYILTLRPSPLPRTFYLQVLPMHKWLSRIVVLMALGHGLAYAHIYRSTGMYFKLRLPENIAGYIALVFFLIAGITAWSWYRRRAYQVFYVLHVLTAWGTLPLIWYHSRPPCTNYLIFCLGLLLYQVIFRLLRSMHIKMRVQAITDNLVVINVPRSTLPRHFERWSPGAHIRLALPLWNPTAWLTSSHPYTISSLDTDPNLQLVIRKGTFPIQMRKMYSMGGPHRCFPYYLENQLKLGQVKRVLFVIGGSGIAFGAPVLRYMRMHGVQVRMIWAIRDPYDAKVLPLIGLHEDVMENRVDIFYSGARLAEDEPEDQDLEITTSENCCEEDEEQTPLLRRNRLNKKVISDNVLCDYVHNMYNSRAHLNLRLKTWLYGLNVEEDDCCCADKLIEAGPENKKGVWVMATGHPKLVSDAKAWAHNADVNFFEEEFAL